MVPRGFLVAFWCCAFVVEVVVGAATVSTLCNFVAGHAYVGGVAKLEAILAHRVFVVGVHAFCLAGPVVDVPGSLFSWDMSWNDEGWFWVESGHDCHKATFRFAVFPVFPVSEEFDCSWGGRCVGCDLSAQVLEVFLFVLVLSLDGSSLECRYCVYETSDR